MRVEPSTGPRQGKLDQTRRIEAVSKTSKKCVQMSNKSFSDVSVNTSPRGANTDFNKHENGKSKFSFGRVDSPNYQNCETCRWYMRVPRPMGTHVDFLWRLKLQISQITINHDFVDFLRYFVCTLFGSWCYDFAYRQPKLPKL